jgi:hypothetical protein
MKDNYQRPIDPCGLNACFTLLITIGVIICTALVVIVGMLSPAPIEDTPPGEPYETEEWEEDAKDHVWFWNQPQSDNVITQ